MPEEDVIVIDGKTYRPGDVIRETDRGVVKFRLIYGGRVREEDRKRLLGER